MRTRKSLQEHRNLLLAGAFGSALMLMPVIAFADSDDTHPATTSQKVDNARDRLQDRKEDIGERKDTRMDRAEDTYEKKVDNRKDTEQDRLHNIHARMQGTSGDRREDLKERVSNVRDRYHDTKENLKDRYQDRRENIRDHAQDARSNVRDKFEDRKENIKDTDGRAHPLGGLQNVSHVKHSTIMKTKPGEKLDTDRDRDGDSPR